MSEYKTLSRPDIYFSTH